MPRAQCLCINGLRLLGWCMRRGNWKVLWRKRKWRIYCWGVHAIFWSHHVIPLPSGLFISSSLMRFKSTLWTCALIHNIASLLTSQSQRGRIYHFLFSRTISTWHIPSHNVCTQQRAILVKCLLSFYDDDNYCHFPFTCSLNILCYSCTCDYICTDLPNIFTYTCITISVTALVFELHITFYVSCSFSCCFIVLLTRKWNMIFVHVVLLRRMLLLTKSIFKEYTRNGRCGILSHS